jgi:O-antigen ligase
VKQPGGPLPGASRRLGAASVDVPGSTAGTLRPAFLVAQDWAMSWKEVLLVGFTVIGASLMTIDAVNARAGAAILLVECFFSMASPLAALTALITSQCVMDPPGWPITATQTLCIACSIQVMLAPSKSTWPGIKSILYLWLPGVLYIYALDFVKYGTVALHIYLALSLIIGLIASYYIGRIHNRFHLALFCMALGFMPLIVGFVLHGTNIDVQGYTASESERGEEGFGAGRGDINYAGAMLALMTWVMIALALSDGIRRAPWRTRAGVTGIAFLSAFLALPACIGAMSRGGFVAYVMGFITLFAFSLKKRRTLYRLVGIILILAIVVFSSGLQRGLGTRLEALRFFTQKQADMSILTSRNDVWTTAFEAIRQNPLIGPIEENPMNRDYQIFCAHNVWLDFGMMAGVPGMLWFSCLFFWPIYRLIKARPGDDLASYFVGYAILFCLFLSLSAVNYKPFWLFWVLCLAVSESARLSATRKRAG